MAKATDFLWGNFSRKNNQYAAKISGYLGLPTMDNEILALQNFQNNPSLNVDWRTVGPKVSFTKKNYQPIHDILIPGVLAITRGNQGGLYNPYVQNNYSGGGPTDTQWNSKGTDGTTYGWVNLPNCLTDRTYSSWSQSVDDWAGYTTLLWEFIMVHTPTNRAWLIKFNQWTNGGNGGGFSYDRWEIYPSVTFTRPNYAGAQKRDILVPGKLEIARLDNQYGIFNYPYEYTITGIQGNYSTNYAMMFTEWNSSYTDPGSNGFGDLSDVRTRTYDSFVNSLDNQVGSNILSTDLVMHDLISDLYYKMVFTAWTQNGNGGGFEYTRTLIPLNSAITYPDGTVQTTV
jgi:hypothetical protein